MRKNRDTNTIYGSFSLCLPFSLFAQIDKDMKEFDDFAEAAAKEFDDFVKQQACEFDDFCERTE